MHSESSTVTFVCETPQSRVSAAAFLLDMAKLAGPMTAVITDQSGVFHISVSMNATRTPSESSATGTGLDGLSITELASSRALAKQEWLRLNPIKEPQSTLSTT